MASAKVSILIFFDFFLELSGARNGYCLFQEMTRFIPTAFDVRACEPFPKVAIA